LARDPADRERQLRLLALVLKQGDDLIMLPETTRELQPEDTILYCGSDRGRRLLSGTLNNPYTLYFLHTGRDEPRSWFGQWLARRFDQPDSKGQSAGQ